MNESEKRVKEVWPDARCVKAMVTDDNGGEGWGYWIDGVSYRRLRAKFGSEKAAWADAASRLPKAEIVPDDCLDITDDGKVITAARPAAPPANEAAPQTFEEWWITEPVAGIWKTNHLGKQIAYAAWNAAKASSPVVAGGESEMEQENLMLKEFINEIYGGAAQGLLVYSRFRRKRGGSR